MPRSMEVRKATIPGTKRTVKIRRIDGTYYVILTNSVGQSMPYTAGFQSLNTAIKHAILMYGVDFGEVVQALAG